MPVWVLWGSFRSATDAAGASVANVREAKVRHGQANNGPCCSTNSSPQRGGNKHPPVAPELARLIAERVPPEMLAQVEQLYRALERAVAEGRPSDELHDVFERAQVVMDRLH